MLKKAVQQGRSEVRDAKNNERMFAGGREYACHGLFVSGSTELSPSERVTISTFQINLSCFCSTFSTLIGSSKAESVTIVVTDANTTEKKSWKSASNRADGFDADRSM